VVLIPDFALAQVITLQPTITASYTTTTESHTTHLSWLPTSTTTPTSEVDLSAHHQQLLQASPAISITATLLSLSLIISTVYLYHHIKCLPSLFPIETYRCPLPSATRRERTCSIYHMLTLDHTTPTQISTLSFEFIHSFSFCFQIFHYT